MTNTRETILKLALTLNYHKGSTALYLSTEIEWLKSMSLTGISFYLWEGVKSGHILEKVKKGELVYYPSAKGLKEYEKNFQ